MSVKRAPGFLILGTDKAYSKKSHAKKMAGLGFAASSCHLVYAKTLIQVVRGHILTNGDIIT
jgi:hypothetical protein